MKYLKTPFSEEDIDGLRVGDVAQYGNILVVDGNLMVAFADIAPVGVSHLTGAVNYAAHDSDDHVLHAGSTLLNLLKGLLKVVHRPPASGASDVLRLVEPSP